MQKEDVIYRRAALDIVLEYDRKLYEYVGTPKDNDMYSFGRGLLLSLERNLKQLPSVQPEVTEEAVKEYCRKRCLCIVDRALLRKYASAQPDITKCGECRHAKERGCALFCEFWGKYTPHSGYCFKAERRKG